MKKIFAAIITFMLPFLLLAQPMDTANVYFENFDGANPKVTTTNIFDATLGDWKTDNTLKVSAPNSYHSPVYNRSGASTVYLSTIDLTNTPITDVVRKFYLEFDHICKVDKLDEAYIYYSKATGLDWTGEPSWGYPQKLTFTQTSPCYLSAGTMNPGGTVNPGATDFTQAGLGSGQFAASWYPSGTGNWQPNTLNANPAANWWRHEKFDLSSFLLDGTTKYVRLEFRVNKSSPSTSNTEQCKGWYLDNINVVLSNCELIPPKITLTSPIYYNLGVNSPTTSPYYFTNNIGPYTIHATLTDNDTVDLSKLQFTYQICPFQAAAGPVVTVQNTITQNTFSTSGNTVKAEWVVPTICYKDTIRYHIYMEDVHGSRDRIDTFLVAHHNYSNIQNNDCHLDSLDKGTWPHCFITGTAHPVKLYFKNRSDADHSIQTGSSYQTALTVGLEVRNEAGQVTHNSTHSWSGSLCFDERDTLNLGTFVPTHGWNHIKVFVKTRNGAVDGNHANDTLKIDWYSCDSLLSGDYTVGGSNPDFVSIQDVKNNLEYCGLGGPVRFHLRPGTYQDLYFSHKYIGQSDVNTISFIGDNRDNVTVVANVPDTSATIYQGALTMINVENLHFQNMTFQGRQQAASRAVVLRGNGSRDIIFDNCKFMVYPTNTTATTSYAVGRETSATTTPDTVILRNCIMEGGNFGVYYVGNTQSGNNRRQNSLTVENCRIKSCYRGIYSKYSMPLVVRNNHITQYPMGSHQEFSGVYVENIVSADIDGNTVDSVFNAEYGISVKNLTTKDYFIRNNHVKVGDSKFGIYIGSSSATSVDTGFIYNNEVILYPVTEGTACAMQLDNSNSLKLAHNSLYVKSDAPYSNTAALHIKNTTSNNITFLNNNVLINECNSSDNTNYALNLNGTSKVIGGYNDLYSQSSAIAYTTVVRNSIAEFENAMPNCTNNISVLPPMANATNSLLPTDFTGMECRRMPLVMQDIRNQQRSALTYMGAYANQIAATDASVVALLVPALGDCPQNTYNITVSVANKGSEVLNFANHNATITVHSDSLNLTQTKSVTSGTVPVLGASSQVVANNVAIPVNQMVDLTFVIRTAGDNNYINDTMRTSFIMEAARPDYEEDFSSGTKQTWTISQLSGAGNWTFIDGTGINPVIAPVYGTGRLYFNSKTFSAQTRSRAVMPVVQLSSSINPILEMWVAHDNTSNKPKEGVVVKVSTNGGLTYTALRRLNPDGTPSTSLADTLIKRYDASYSTPGWALYTFDLSNYVSAGCIYIAFDGYAQQGNNINIDRIRLRNLYNNDVAVTQIYSQGETPTKYAMRDVYGALVRNEGRQSQSNVDVYLTVTGAAETYRDTVTIPTLGNNQQTLVTFPDHEMQVNEVKNVEIRSRNDQNNSNNALNWRMVTNNNTANYADTTSTVMKTGDYSTVIRPCVRYKTNEELVVTDVKYFYNQSYITNRDRGFKAFVSNAAGQIVATSDVISFDSLQQGAWNILPIRNFALTNMTGEFYVGLEMTANGDYLTYQVETPLRDSTFYYLENNGTYTPQSVGRFMIGAVVDTPHVHDFAILDMTNPTSRCDLGHEHITLTVTNNGSQAILPGTQLHYRINNLPVVTETMTDTLGSHETKSFVFNTIYDFTNHQINIDDNYNIIVWVSKDSRDRLQYNDTLRQMVVSKGKSAMPIAADTVNISYYTSGTLTASLPPSIQQGVLAWYNSSGYEQWNFLTYASSLQTPVIFFDTTFFVTANPGYVYDKIIGTGKGTSTSPTTINQEDKPFVFGSGYSRGRMIYTQNDIGQYGPVARIGFYVTTKATGENGIPIKLYLKETPLNTLPNDAYDWNNEILDATLVLDDMVFFGDTGWYYFNLPTPFNYTTGNLMLLTETNCNDYCNSCNNCGAAVSGTTVYPKFQATAVSGCVQYKNANVTAMTGTWGTAYGKRLNLAIRIADLQCGSEKHQIYVHVPDIPIYDVETISLDYPQVSQTTPYPSHCALYDEHIRVTLKNNLNVPIPANKVVVHARFNNQEITHLITEPFGSEEVKTVVFDTTFDFATHNHADVTYNCVVYTDMPTESIVYRGNDTIRGTFISKRTAQFPRNPIVYQGNYTETFTVLQPADRPVLANGNTEITQWRYYADSLTATALTPLPTTANPTYTTGPLYDTVVVWVEAKTQTSNCMTRRTPIYINVQVPQYDLETRYLISPKSFQCGISANQPVVVSVRNTDTTSSSVIPTNTFNVTGRFVDGAYVVTDTKPLTTPVPHLDTATVTLNLSNMSSTTANRSYNYTIYSKPINNNMWVYKGNDTITGMLYVPANPVAPQPLTYNVAYGNTQTVSPTGMSFYYFYHNQNDAVPFAQGTSYTTDPIFSSQTLYYSGRIESAGFKETITAGTGNTTNSAPFNMLSTRGKSYAQILYTKDDIGGVSGTIDSIYVKVNTANTTGIGIPIRMWLANVADQPALTTAPSLTTWTTLTNNAQLVFDGDMAFDQLGWVAIPVNGRFDYNGGAIMMYVEHDCGDNSCVTNLGIVEPKFANTAYANNNNQRRIYQLAAATGTAFTGGGNRWSTKFLFNYTCSSPKSPITINTTVPQHDVGVIGITAPTSPNQYTANEPVTIMVKNFGSAAASNFAVSYRLGNGVPVTETYTGTLAAGATGTRTFTAQADLTSAYMEMPFCAYTGLNNDALHANDTFCMTLNVGDPCISRSNIATGLDISNVTVSTINNGQGTPFTNYTAEGDGMYTDYTSTVPAAELIQGQTYPMSITHSFTTATASGTIYKTLYIDWNRNGVFETGEKVKTLGPIASTAANATTQFTFDIPSTASLGLTRMRVICVAANYTNGCGIYSYAGETEDYAVTIVPPKPKDLGISQIIHPVGNVCVDTAATVKVLLKNFGSETQYFTPGNAATVTVTFTGANAGTYTTTVAAGSVASNNTYTVTIPHVNISSLGAFNVTASVSYPGDMFALNDATTAAANTNVLGPIVSNINEFEDNFDMNTGTTDLHFDYSRWLVPTGSDTANYIWVINSKNSPNSGANYGPAHDHTQINTLQADFGRYAMVEGKNGTVNKPKWTAATTRCLNMHRQTQYPIELVFYKYFYAPAAATNANTSLKLTIEAGSGNDFVLVDTLTFANNRNTSPNWERFVTTIKNFNSVGQLKFTMSNHSNRIDPAIDDIYLGPGYPDLEVVNFIHPTDNVNTNCLIMGDSVHPTITLRNNGYSPIGEFDLRFIMSVGTKFDTLYEHVTRTIESEDTIHYTTSKGFLVHYNFRPLSFRVDCYVDLDKNPENDYYTVVTCTNSGVEDYAEENGVVLEQNEPNPAVTTTRISYRLPDYGEANISIYSALGQQLYSQDQAGSKGVNYLDVNTSNWAAGVYYYTLSFKDTSITKKMVIQK